MEAIQLSPVLVEDDDFYFHLMGAEVSNGTGLIADNTPPFKLYPANFNHVQPLGNPFVAPDYRDRYYGFCTGSAGLLQGSYLVNAMGLGLRVGIGGSGGRCSSHEEFGAGGPCNLRCRRVRRRVRRRGRAG